MFINTLPHPVLPKAPAFTCQMHPWPQRSHVTCEPKPSPWPRCVFAFTCKLLLLAFGGSRTHMLTFLLYTLEAPALTRLPAVASAGTCTHTHCSLLSSEGVCTHIPMAHMACAGTSSGTFIHIPIACLAPARTCNHMPTGPLWPWCPAALTCPPQLSGLCRYLDSHLHCLLVS